MEKKDFTFNEFEMQAITKLCPDRRVVFNETDLTYPHNVVYTTVLVYDLNNKFHFTFTSCTLASDRSGWKKTNISNLINNINYSRPMPEFNGSGLCPEVWK